MRLWKNDKISAVMKIVEKIEQKIDEDLSLRMLVKLVLLFALIWLLIQTGSFWGSLFDKIWNIISPFVIGFVIAYILRGFIYYGEQHHISRKVSVPVIYGLILVLLVWLLSSLFPMVINRAGDFISSLINGINWLSRTLVSNSKSGTSQWVKSLVSELTGSLTDVKNLIPDLTKSLPDLINTFIGTIVRTIFAIVISIFMCFSWEKIRTVFVTVSKRISEDCYETLFAVNHELGTYVRSLLILIIIKIAEYAVVYLLVGHPDWLILAILTGISLIVPYIGPTIINIIGIVTALTLPGSHVIALIIVILILSNVDPYVIEPMVHSHNTAITPLWALFSVFCGGVLLGSAGVIIAIPAYLSIRVIVLRHLKKPEENVT